jgi:hypothetical protein
VKKAGFFFIFLLGGAQGAFASSCDTSINYQNQRGEILRVLFDSSSECTPIAVIQPKGELDSVFSSMLAPTTDEEIVFIRFAVSECPVDAYLQMSFKDQSTFSYRTCKTRYAADEYTRIPTAIR